MTINMIMSMTTNVKAIQVIFTRFCFNKRNFNMNMLCIFFSKTIEEDFIPSQSNAETKDNVNTDNKGDIKALHKKRRDHSNTKISNNEKDIINKLKLKAAKGQKAAMKKLCWVSLIGVLFMSGEFIGGYFSNSTAIMSDAAHMLSDFLGFGISMISIIISTKSPTQKLSYGYHRAEIVGALVSVV